MLNYLLFTQAICTLFVSGGFFFKEKNLKSRTISIYLFLYSLEILYFLYGTTDLYNIFPELYGRFYFSIGMCYGPLLFIHIRSITDPQKQVVLKDLLHFVPILFLNIYLYDLLTMPGAQRVEHYENIDNAYHCTAYVNYVRMVHQVGYGALLSFLYFRNRKDFDINKRVYICGVSIIYFCTTILISLITIFANSCSDFSAYYIFCYILVAFILFTLYRKPKIFQNIKSKYLRSTLKQADAAEIKKGIEQLFTHHKIYLDGHLSIADIATKLQTSSTYISQTFSETMNTSFTAYVNKHRIEHAKKLLESPQYINYKIEGIALESGFNNRTTFYKAFSKFEGTTPSKYRSNYLNS